MGKYTLLDELRVDRTIEKQLSYITKLIVEHVHPASIILLGSFGRGEGSVIMEGSNLRILSDYDIGVVTKKFWKRRLLDELSRKISTELNVETKLGWLTPSRVKNNEPSNFSFGSYLPSIFMYELKAGSKLLYGRNYLNENTIASDSIPLWEGIRLLFNRMSELLQYFTISTLQNLKDGNVHNLNLMKWISKIILACADSLLISVNKYHYSYKVRYNIFCKEYPNYFQQIFPRLYYFPSLVHKASNFQLYPSHKILSSNTLTSWSKIALICDKVFRYLLYQDLGISFSSYSEFPEKYLNQPNVRYKYDSYRPYLMPIPKAVYMNLINELKLTKAKISLFRSFRKIMVPWNHVVYSIVPLIFFSISEDGKVNRDLLRRARVQLEWLKKLEPPFKDSLREWDYLRSEVAHMWSIFLN